MLAPIRLRRRIWREWCWRVGGAGEGLDLDVHEGDLIPVGARVQMELHRVGAADEVAGRDRHRVALEVVGVAVAGDIWHRVCGMPIHRDGKRSLPMEALHIED